jgi:hypothetical protein
MKKLIAISLLLFTVGVNAQNKTFRWSSELCDHVGTYDSKKNYTEAQLRDTMKLMDYTMTYLSNFPHVWKWEDIDKLDVGALDAEYKVKTEKLKALNVVDVPYFQNAKNAQLKELEQKYILGRAKLLAFRTPEVLRDYPAAEACKLKFVEPLIAKDESLFKVWLDVSIDSRSRNGDPGRLKRIFEEQMASPDRLKFAIIEVMGFGFGNCANAVLERDEGSSNGSHEREFRKLFRSVRDVNCSEP